MKIALVTDAWQPQVNGVVTTLVGSWGARTGRRGHEVHVIHPASSARALVRATPASTWPCGRAAQMARQLDALQPQAVHIATEGPLGWAARAHCRRRGWRFTTAFHTKFPEILHAAR